MAGIADADWGDVINTTLDKLPSKDFTMPLQLQHYEVMSQLLPKDRVDIQSGKAFTFDVKVAASGAASHVRPYERTVVGPVNVLQPATVPWRFAQTFFTMEENEMAMNAKPAMFIKLADVRRQSAYVDLADELESKGWAAPTGVDDETSPMGVPYWIVKAAADATEGFEGRNATGFAAGPGGLSAETYPLTRNWVARGTGYYEDWDETLVTTVRKAFLKINFMAPPQIDQANVGSFRKFRFYMNDNTYLALFKLASKQNDNVGWDLFANDGSVYFKRTPFVYLPVLDTDATDPIYMLNMGSFGVMALRGRYLKATPAIRGGVEQHLVWTTFVDLTYNFKCQNRRLNAVISK